MSHFAKPKYAVGDPVAVCLYESDIVRGTVQSVVPATMAHIKEYVNAVVGEPLYLIRTSHKGPPVAYAVREIDSARAASPQKTGFLAMISTIPENLRNAYYGRASRAHHPEP